ncbi:MAG: hypothetical protein R3C97_12540 [Geminicoccaceae bacterium]
MSATADGRELSISEPTDLVEPTRFTLEGFGDFHVIPGSEGLGERQRHWHDAEAKRRELFERTAVSSSDTLTRWPTALGHPLNHRAACSQERRALLGDRTTDSMEREAAALERRIEEAPAGPAVFDAEIDPERLRARMAVDEEDLDRVERRLATHEHERQAVREALAVNRSRLIDLTAREKLERETLTRSMAELADDDLEASLVQAREKHAGTATRHARLELALSDEDPAWLDDQAAMLERAIEQIVTDRRRRERVIEDLAIEIRHEGGDGIGERRDQAKAELEAAERELARVKREAEAAKLLHDLLQEERKRSRDLLTAPVRSRLEKHLPFVIPGARARIDAADFSLSDLERGEIAEPFDTLSIGTREQLSVMIRLAFAELVLDRHGEAPPLILDDALVYADEERFDRMKTLLSRAGQSLQIIILTCRPRDYVGLGKSYRLEECLLS